MNEETASLAIEFLKRVHIQPTEIPAFRQVNEALVELIMNARQEKANAKGEESRNVPT